MVIQKTLYLWLYCIVILSCNGNNDNECVDDLMVKKYINVTSVSPEEYFNNWSYEESVDISKNIQNYVIQNYINLNKINLNNYLEVGVGEGASPILYEKYFKSLTLIEPNQIYINSVKKRLKDLNIDNSKNKIVFIKEFIQDIDINKIDKKFDLIIAAHVLLHVPINEMDQTLKSLSDLLSTNGILVISAVDEKGVMYNMMIKHYNDIINSYDDHKLPKKLQFTTSHIQKYLDNNTDILEYTILEDRDEFTLDIDDSIHLYKFCIKLFLNLYTKNNKIDIEDDDLRKNMFNTFGKFDSFTGKLNQKTNRDMVHTTVYKKHFIIKRNK